MERNSATLGRWGRGRPARVSSIGRFFSQATRVTVRRFRSTAVQEVRYRLATAGYSHFDTMVSRSGSWTQRWTA